MFESTIAQFTALAVLLPVVAGQSGNAGALVPMLLRRIGQDSATASSIILTTVTDVVGFSRFSASLRCLRRCSSKACADTRLALIGMESASPSGTL